jgi:hypothetical protein
VDTGEGLDGDEISTARYQNTKYFNNTARYQNTKIKIDTARYQNKKSLKILKTFV